MRRKLLLIFLLVLTVMFSIGAIVIDKRITAFKQITSGDDLPEQGVNIRFLDSSEVEFSGVDLAVPVVARTANYPIFSWVLSGNFWGELELKIEMSPMYLNGNSLLDALPYTAYFVHTLSRIGNTQIPLNNQNPSTATPFDFFGYSISYSDGVKYGQSKTTGLTTSNLTVTKATGNQSMSFFLNLSENSIVGYQTLTQQEAKASFTTNINVCDFWNRYGDAYIRLNIPTDGAGYDGGLYKADVTVTIQVQ